jgi:hypothetical protein
VDSLVIKPDRDGLFVIDSFLDDESCDTIYDFCIKNPRSFIDRSKVGMNLGLRGEVGSYSSMLLSAETTPKLWEEIFSGIGINNLYLDSVMVNRYRDGDYIPPHRDKQSCIYTVTVALEDNKNNNLVFGDENAWYDIIPLEESDKLSDTKSFKDVKGRGVGFYGNKPVHWVPHVSGDRYSLICLYGAITY